MGTFFLTKDHRGIKDYKLLGEALAFQVLQQLLELGPLLVELALVELVPEVEKLVGSELRQPEQLLPNRGN